MTTSSDTNQTDEQPNQLGPEYVLTKILTPSSKFAFARSMIASKAYEAWTNLLITTKALPKPPSFTLAALDPTPTDATTRALELAQQLVPPSVVNHMIRTYYFGMAIAAWKGKIAVSTNSEEDEAKEEHASVNYPNFDREAFWTACVLHDIGVSPELSPPADSNTGSDKQDETITALTNFEVRGGTRAHSFVTQELEPPFNTKRAWLVHEAIALHTSKARHGEPDATEGMCWAEMLFDGAATDLTAMSLSKLCPETIVAVLREHPKLDVHKVFPQMLRKECGERPCCLIAQSGEMGLFDIMEKGGAAFTNYESS
mmetsp:Transcript_31217/g.57675  ORF Transcript_31217/g.57675 Transcript_31217/m.57675 type:complete len:314 (-) Transcript_31217:97-1038(-)